MGQPVFSMKPEIKSDVILTKCQADKSARKFYTKVIIRGFQIVTVQAKKKKKSGREGTKLWMTKCPNVVIG